MKIYKNVLNDETLQKCHDEAAEFAKKPVWRPSDGNWGEHITEGVAGLCLGTFVSPELFDIIEPLVKDKLPAYNNLMIQHYVWHKNAAINLHNDKDQIFGATIYLNKNWDINNGGLFVWKDEAEDLKNLAKNNYVGKMSALCPSYNMMVVNTNKSWHLVTAVSPYITENRITLQIWGS
jgi:hypothetical protein